jgi:methylated-DNA-[protein]-cysteine S-methyltransferase
MATASDTRARTIDSPVGRLTLVASNDALLEIRFERGRGSRGGPTVGGREDPDHPILCMAEKELSEYFAGSRRSFDVPTSFAGTPFQNRVWRLLLKIPYGKTVSYGELAARIGDARKARAVGAAVARNPISVIVPCHRVVGKTGDLTGFGGGLRAKSFLLKLEKGDQQLQ